MYSPARDLLSVSANHLLAALGPSAEPLLEAGREVTIAPGELLQLTAHGSQDVAFPVCGLLSSRLISRGGGAIEVAVVGAGGAIGLTAALGESLEASEHHAIIASRAWVAPARAVRTVLGEPVAAKHIWRCIAAEADSLRRDLCCASLHDGLVRFADRLLLYVGALGAARINITQDSLATALGVQRTTVTAFVGQLSARGLVGRWRGSLTVLDQPGLARLACGCRSRRHAPLE